MFLWADAHTSNSAVVVHNLHGDYALQVPKEYRNQMTSFPLPQQVPPHRKSTFSPRHFGC